jgi:cytoskeletal protein CcmA (bactofilin family)
MAKQNINVGTAANDKKGDSLRAAFVKVNANFTELYTELGLVVDANLNLGAFEFAGSTLSTTDSTAIVIDQATTITSNLSVGGDITVNQTATITSNLSVGGNITVSGDITLPNGAIIRDSVDNTLASGVNAGNITAQNGAIAIGQDAGSAGQGYDAIAIGSGAGGGFLDLGFQGQEAIAIGSGAGADSQGVYSIAIGSVAGQTNQAPLTIILNATASALNGVVGQVGSFYVAPIRNAGGTSGLLQYNLTTKEVSYSSDITSEGNINIDINLSDSTLRRWQFGEDGNLETPGGIQVAGILKIDDGVHEQFQAKVDATGVVTHNCSSGHIFYHTSPDANWTANFTNLNLDSTYATSVTLIIVQGATGYYPSAVQIGGAAQTINWQGNVNPTVSTSRTDVVTFSIINNSGTYTVLGQLTGF